MKIGIVGATGIVGNKILEIIEEKQLKFESILTAASENSVGTEIEVSRKKYKIIDIEELLRQKPKIVIFSAGSKVSKKWAPLFANNDIFVIDNSSAWRMDKNIKLIVPEINKDLITENDKIIANPNCVAIPVSVVLEPLHKIYGIKRLIISTYQAVSGSGRKAVNELIEERKFIDKNVSKDINKTEYRSKNLKKSVYPYQIDMNVIPHIGELTENGYTFEEIKIIEEIKKILDDPTINITVTAVRIPILNGHSESLNIEFNQQPDLEVIKNIYKKTKHIKLEDSQKEQIYPMPLTANNRDEVNVGRIRKDYSNDKSINMWVVSDNIRKGAASNTLQILEFISKKFLNNMRYA